MAQRIFKPDDFHGKTEEDAGVWLTHFEKVAAANEWTANNKLRIVPVFLKGAAERWFVRQGCNVWSPPEDPGDDDVPFTFNFLAHFDTEAKKSRWNDQFDALRQGKKSVEEYNEEFLHLWRRVDPLEQYPDEVLMRKYIGGLKVDIGAHTYAQAFHFLAEGWISLFVTPEDKKC